MIVLGGRAFSEPLRSWARNELQGYPSPDAPLPTYRTITAPLQADSHSRFWQGCNETISALDLPEIAHDLISERLPVTFSVGKIQNLIAGQDPPHTAQTGPTRQCGTSPPDDQRAFRARGG
ncbi:AbiTii domain-containing protein [Streptomyces hawaiiensis]|uniref:AbiTii domain-containing protein n=1 Tax=Streptomyces hawaiiensis TaxID=67305 RepID=UPI003652C4CC